VQVTEELPTLVRKLVSEAKTISEHVIANKQLFSATETIDLVYKYELMAELMPLKVAKQTEQCVLRNKDLENPQSVTKMTATG
jgi:hypothetical protein